MSSRDDVLQALRYIREAENRARLVVSAVHSLNGDSATYWVHLSYISHVLIDGERRDALPLDDPGNGGDGLSAGGLLSEEDAYGALYRLLQRVTFCRVMKNRQNFRWDENAKALVSIA